jgi:hypothetical protein
VDREAIADVVKGEVREARSVNSPWVKNLSDFICSRFWLFRIAIPQTGRSFADWEGIVFNRPKNF